MPSLAHAAVTGNHSLGKVINAEPTTVCLNCQKNINVNGNHSLGTGTSHALGASSSNQVVFIGSNLNINGNGDGALPIDSTVLAASGVSSFNNLDPSLVDDADLAPYDTVVLMVVSPEMKGTTATLLGPSKTALVNFVANGGKMIIYDREAKSNDYTWLPYQFTTNNPGPTGILGGTLSVADEDRW